MPENESVWIKSEPDEAGTYHLYLELGPDDVVPLGVEEAYGWAREVLSATAAAEYDAAVLRQLKHVGIDKEAVVEMVRLMRDDRAEHIPVSMIPGLALVPGVSAFTGNGFLRLDRHHKRVGQWELDDARQHALGVIEALEVTTLDSAYLRALEHHAGIDRGRALQIVTDLANHRCDQPCPTCGAAEKRDRRAVPGAEGKPTGIYRCGDDWHTS